MDFVPGTSPKHMPVLIPDCLEIEPDEMLVIWSRGDTKSWSHVAGDYPACTPAELSAHSDQPVVLLVIFTDGASLEGILEEISSLQLPSVGKTYFAFQARPRFALWHFLRQWKPLLRMMPGADQGLLPVIYANGGMLVMNLALQPVKYTRNLDYTWILVLKSCLKYWLRLSNALMGIEFILVDVTECLN